jgi:hypothetical protein
MLTDRNTCNIDCVEPAIVFLQTFFFVLLRSLKVQNGCDQSHKKQEKFIKTKERSKNIK